MVVDAGRTGRALVCAIVLCGGGDCVRVYMVSDFLVIGEWGADRCRWRRAAVTEALVPVERRIEDEKGGRSNLRTVEEEDDDDDEANRPVL